MGTIKSKFNQINRITGGYAPGTVTAFQTLGGDDDQEALQTVVEEEMRNAALTGIKTLVISFQMTDEELVKCLITGQDEKTIERLSKSPVLIKGKDNGDKPKAGRGTAKIDGFVRDKEPRLLVIDAIDEIIPEGTDYDTALGITRTILGIAERNDIAVIISDYANRFETGVKRDDRMTEIEIKTDIHGLTQARIISNRVWEEVGDIRWDPDKFNIE